MLKFTKNLFAMAAITLISAPAYAQSNMLESYDDESPIVLSGTVAAVNDDNFTMNYGEGIVTVEMQEWGLNDPVEHTLDAGDSVIVSGAIDDDLFEGREIEADTVYLVTDSAYYYNREPEQPIYYFHTMETTTLEDQQPQTGSAVGQTTTAQTAPQSWVSAVGTVREVQNQEFTIDAGRYDFVVDAQRMVDDIPDVGERVYVAGLLDQDFFTNRQIEANRVVTLSAAGGQAGAIQQREQLRQQRDQDQVE